MSLVLRGATVFDGETFLENRAVVMDGDRIKAIIAERDVGQSLHVMDLKGGILAPGFIDVQVNGGGGALLNDNPTIAVMQKIATSHRKHGTTALLPTVITDTPDVISSAVSAVRSAIKTGVPGVLGIHIEGPFLDPARKGAHDPNLIRAPTPDDISILTTLDCGAVMLTVAPNVVPAETIATLCKADVKVSLGHSNATFEQAKAALDAGASAFTHLFNAMSQLNGREPGMVGAALSDSRSFMGIIADGFHVHEATLRLALAAAASDRFMLITDAMPPAAGGPDSFDLQGRKVTRKNGRLELADGTLAGSNLTMDEAVRYCVNRLGVPLANALQMASRNPARFLGRNDLGRIAPGALASLVHLDDQLNVMQTWINGT
jgi:N-acetylglucosamine-6-phosphate deacetylase